MNRTVITVPQGADMVRETVRIEDDPGPGTGPEGFMTLWRFIQSLETAPAILRHSTDCPAVITIKHSGTAWYVEATSTFAVRDGSSADPASAA
jgi:hypothetical protein